MRRLSTAVTITDPLVKYQSMVAAGIYSPDPAQHRLARHLHKLYLSIKDYSPHIEYRQRLSQVARFTETKKPEPEEAGEGILALPYHAIWRNPLFKHLLSSPVGRESMALTRVLTNYQTAIEMDSPRGLFLSGEVGTGKSMLLDLLADGLPTGKKGRWHFHTFMLYTFAQLDAYRASNSHLSNPDSGYSLLWMAKKLVSESPVLFLDEFQLPDRAAGKILCHLFIAFFQLGGVLVASSNRMPEELEKATGVDYTRTSGGLMRKILGRGFGQTNDFASFLDVLRARCEFWQMEGAQDWRRKEEDSTNLAITTAAIGAIAQRNKESEPTTKKPHHYHIWQNGDADNDGDFQHRVQEAVSCTESIEIPWEPSAVVVYGRKVLTPRHYKGFAFWNFDDLVASFGPADYITMASSYHTFIIDRVPVLTILSKNEARRFITLLDALYEARCKLIVRAQSPPDHLFFPGIAAAAAEATTATAASTTSNDKNIESDDATYSETLAEVYQDSMSPFRPNVSYYDTNTSTAKYDPDQDSDFGLPGTARPRVDFRDTGAFTGEDERFAYKRAASRLWELCSARWHARGGDWWRPLPVEARHWEKGASKPRVVRPGAEEREKEEIDGRRGRGGEGMGESVAMDQVAGLAKWRIERLMKEEEETSQHEGQVRQNQGHLSKKT